MVTIARVLDDLPVATLTQPHSSDTTLATGERNCMSPMSRIHANTQALPGLPSGAAWLALKRALLGVVLLSVFISAGAWLMYAGIESDPDASAVAAEQVSSVSSKDAHR
jgi:hypothetical protein